MQLAWGILNAGLSFLALFLIFRPLELAFPAKEGQRFFRPQWWTDLWFLLGQYLFFNGAVLWVLGHADHWLAVAVPGQFRAWVGGQNWLTQAVLVVLLGDLLIYWGHRFQHRVGFLWRFHSIHHSSEHLDWLAAHREHPVDALYTIFLVNLPMLALGVPVTTLVWFAGFRGLWAVFIHANVRLPIGPPRVLIGAPELHHWHHDRSRNSGNYANVSPLMDVLFGTYRCPDHEPAALGVAEPMPKGYFGQLLYPFVRRERGDAPLTQRQAAGAAQGGNDRSAAPDPNGADRANGSGAPLRSAPGLSMISIGESGSSTCVAPRTRQQHCR